MHLLFCFKAQGSEATQGEEETGSPMSSQDQQYYWTAQAHNDVILQPVQMPTPLGPSGKMSSDLQNLPLENLKHELNIWARGFVCPSRPENKNKPNSS